MVKNMYTHRCLLLSSIVFAAVSIFLLIPILFTGNVFTADSYEYLNSSENFRSEGSFFCGDSNDERGSILETKRTPGYPLFLSIFGSNPDFRLISVFQVILSIAAFIIISKFASGRLGIKCAALYILFAYIMNPSQFLYPLFIMSETLFELLLLLSFIFAYLFIKEKRVRDSFFSMFFLSAAMLVKPVLLSTAPVLGVLFIYSVLKERSSKTALLSLFIPVLVFLSLSLFNQSKSGSFSFSSIGSVNLMRYNTYMFLESSKGSAAADSFLQECTSDSSGVHEESREWRYIRLSLNEIGKDIFGYSAFHLKGVLNFFLDPGRFDVNQYIYGRNAESKGLLRKFSGGGYAGVAKALLREDILLLALYMTVFAFNAAVLILYVFSLFDGGLNSSKLAGLVFILSVALATGPVGASRFKVPVFPVMVFYILPYLKKIFRPRQD